eukprot:6593118-Alexandrium_andersonii.AAC.1
MSASLVGSEMCIRDSLLDGAAHLPRALVAQRVEQRVRREHCDVNASGSALKPLRPPATGAP